MRRIALPFPQKSGRPYARASILVAATLILVLASCTTPVPGALQFEPETMLPPGAMAYTRLDGAIMEEAILLFAGTGADKAQKKAMQASMKPFIGRTRTLLAAIMPMGKNGVPGDAYAIASGTFPLAGTKLALASGTTWKKTGNQWVNTAGSLYVSTIDDGCLLLGTASLTPMRSRILATEKLGANPIPENRRSAWDAPFALYLGNPVEDLGASLPIGDGEVPLLSIFCTGNAPGQRGYTMHMSFEFDSAQNALIFSPLCRLFLYAAAHRFWPDKAATILDEAIWRIDTRYVSVSGFFLEAADIAAFTSLLR